MLCRTSREGPGGGAGRCAGEVVEMVALGVRQAQGAGQPGQHLARRARTAGLLQPRVVLGRDERQLRHLLAAQPRGAAARPGGQSHVGGGDPLAPAAQEVGQFSSVHASSVRGCAEPIQVLPVPGCGRARRRRLAAMDNTLTTGTSTTGAPACWPARSPSSPVPAAASAPRRRGCSPGRAPGCCSRPGRRPSSRR